MSNQQMCVAIYMTPAQADEAFSRLQGAGFGMGSLSIMGRDYWERMLGSRNVGERFTYRGPHGAFWERLWANLDGWGIFWFFKDGPVMLAGPLVRAVIATQEQGGADPNVTGFVAAFSGIGIPRASLEQYEGALMKDQILVFVFGVTKDIQRAQAVLDETKAINHTLHHGVGELIDVPRAGPVGSGL